MWALPSRTFLDYLRRGLRAPQVADDYDRKVLEAAAIRRSRLRAAVRERLIDSLPSASVFGCPRRAIRWPLPPTTTCAQKSLRVRCSSGSPSIDQPWLH
jgi:hypothetical protein